MKPFILSFVTLFFFNGFKAFSQPNEINARTGYSIQLNIKPFKNQWVYLAYYYGGIKGLADSAFLDAESRGVLKGETALPQGIYILASPAKTILFEMLVGEQQHFSASADTLNLEKSLQFTGSTDNAAFLAYSAYINPRGRTAEVAQTKIAQATEKEKKALLAIIEKSNSEIAGFRTNYLKKSPETLLGVLFKSMEESPLPAQLQKPITRQDSIAQYRWAKEHYWDHVDLMDGRLIRTPIFEQKLKAYLNNWVTQSPDSLIHEFNWMIALGRNDPEMFRYLVGYFVDNYMYPKIMGHDKVFMHVYERYISGDEPKADWLNEKQLKIINERAYMLMANQLGTQAWDIELADTSGNMKNLYGVKAEYTVIAFWDVHCGKCREDLPKMDSLYQQKWKKEQVKIYAVMVNEESLKEWPTFINENTNDWVHVHQSVAMKAAEDKAKKPNFRQLYDMRSTPMLYLLDKDKRIIAKNLSLTDLDMVLQEKIKNKPF